MTDTVEMLEERIDTGEGAGIKVDLMQCDITHDVHYFLENEGDTWKDCKVFLENLLKELKKHKAEHNVGETQDIKGIKTTFQLQHNVMDVLERAERTGCGEG